MKKFATIIMFLVGIVLVSCSSEYDDNAFYAKSKGDWMGTYVGSDDKGVWKMEIHENGHIFGSTTSEVFEETYEIYATLEKINEVWLITGEVTSGAKFTGKIVGNRMEGIWEVAFSDSEAEWNGQRQ